MSMPGGVPVTCSTRRGSGAIAVGSQGTDAPHLVALVCKSYFSGPGTDVAMGVLRPASMRAQMDQFGVAYEHAFKVHADWTNPHGEAFPVAVQDWLVLPTGDRYAVVGVSLQRPVAMTLLVTVPTPGGGSNG